MMAEGFAAIPTWMIRDTRIPRNALLVYAALSSRSGYREIYPSQETIAQESGLSDRTVRKMLKELESLGVLTRQRRHVAGSRRAPDGYLLHPHGLPEESSASSDLPEAKAASTGNEQLVTPSYTDRESEIDICASAQPQSAHSFDEWWEIYPLKKDKGRARTAWKSALKKTSAEVLLSAAVAYRDDPNRNPSFTKYPASWLNAEAWENGPLPQRAINPTGGTAVERMAATARAMQQEGGRRELVG